LQNTSLENLYLNYISYDEWQKLKLPARSQHTLGAFFNAKNEEYQKHIFDSQILLEILIRLTGYNNLEQDKLIEFQKADHFNKLKDEKNSILYRVLHIYLEDEKPKEKFKEVKKMRKGIFNQYGKTQLPTPGEEEFIATRFQ